MSNPANPELKAMLDRLAERVKERPIHPDHPPAEELRCDFCSDIGRVIWDDGDEYGACPKCELGMAAMTIPERFRMAHLARDFARVPQVQGWTGKSPGWYLCGPVGVGKSHLAAALCREAARHQKHARFISTAQYLEHLRQGMDDEDIAAKARWTIEQLALADVVVLDDLGSENLSNWAQEQLLLLVNRLYNHDTALIVTSNFDQAELSRHLDERVTSRIAGLTELLPLRGPDRRQRERRPRVVQA